jgi:hypothetical protein
MSIEPARGCGFRKVGGLYLVGEGISVPCDRLPFPLTHCPVCGAGFKPNRGIQEINPFHLFQQHINCGDRFRPCLICDPRDEVAYIMTVGERSYTPETFAREALNLGVSKRIAQVPKKLVPGKTVVYLGHPKACERIVEPVLQQVMSMLEESETKQPRLVDSERKEQLFGIFMAFIPQRVEKLMWETDATDEVVEEHAKKGITIVKIPNGDYDHAQ